jgi:hypothetical protein
LADRDEPLSVSVFFLRYQVYGKMLRKVVKRNFSKKCPGPRTAAELDRNPKTAAKLLTLRFSEDRWQGGDCVI